MLCDFVILLAYVITSHHANLSKMSKHWGSFLTHCRYSLLPALSLDGIIHAKIVEGSFTTALFYVGTYSSPRHCTHVAYITATTIRT